jgi:hypothetical protein
MARSRERGAVVALALSGMVAALLPTVTTRTVAEAAPAHPRLLFSAADVPALQQKVTSGVAAQAYASLITKVDAFTQCPASGPGGSTVPTTSDPLLNEAAACPTNPVYLDPAQVTYNYLNQGQMGADLADLGFAWQLSGNPAYGRRAVDLLVHIADGGFIAWQHGAGDQDLGIGDLMKGYGLAFDWTYSLMTGAERSDILARITQYETYLFGDMTTRPGALGNDVSNWIATYAGGDGVALLAVNGETGAPADTSAQITTATNLVQTQWSTGYGALGAGTEGYLYAGAGLRDAIPFAVALKRDGLTDLVAAVPHMKNVVDWAAYEMIPGQKFAMVPLNDSTTDGPNDELPELLFALNPGDQTTRWFWEHTNGPAGDNRYDMRNDVYVQEHNCADPVQSPVQDTVFCASTNAEAELIMFNDVDQNGPGVTPTGVLPFSRWFSERGLVDSRTGWSAGGGDVVSTFEAHHNKSGHDQEDVGQFTLYGYGGSFAIDSGYGHIYDPTTCARENLVYHCGNFAGDSALAGPGSADGHNVVLVGNQANTQQYAQLQTTAATIVDDITGPDYADDLADTRYQFPAGQSPHSFRERLLDAVPGRPVLLAVVDSMEPDGQPHGYDWQMHTDSENAVTVAGERFTIAAPSGAVLSGITTRASGIAAPFIAEPYYPLPGNRPYVQTVIKEVDPIPTAATPQSAVYDHLALMALVPAGTEPPVLTNLSGFGGEVTESTWGGLRDVVVAQAAGSTRVTAGDLATDAAFAKATEGSCETVMRHGTSFAAFGVTLVSVSGGAADVSCGGGSIAASGPAGATYTVYSPTDPASVTVNGAAVAWTRQGTSVVFS